MNGKYLLCVCILMLGMSVAGCGPAGEQEAEQILSGAAQTVAAGITVVPDTPEPSLDVHVVVKQTFAALTQEAGGQKPSATPIALHATHTQDTSTATHLAFAATSSPEIATGGISGTLMYPAGSGGMPSLRIVAFQVGASRYFYVDTALGGNTYQIDGLPPARYHVVAYTLAGGGFNPGPVGGYSQMVPCGLRYGCNDHTLIDVVVTAGHVTTGIGPNDYYAPPGTFPPNPVP